ncbi:MAG: NfeD family protein [Fuerstiella sp.]
MATVLLIAGLFLIALELMVPSFGIIGIAAFICLVISFWSAGQAWWGTSPGFFWTYLTFLTLGIPGVTGGVLFLLQSTPLGKRVILKGQSKESLAPLTKVRNELSDLIGEHGTAATLLTPGGMIEIKGRRYHAESVGMMLETGAPIVVHAVRGTRVVVRPPTDQDVAELEESVKKTANASSDRGVPSFLPEQVLATDSAVEKPLESSEATASEESLTSSEAKKSSETVVKSEETGEEILDFQIPE